MLDKKIFSVFGALLFILSVILLTPSAQVFACSIAPPILGGQPQQRLVAEGVLVTVSSVGTPQYANLDEYTLVYKDHRSGAECGPYRYYIKTPIVWSVEAVLVIFVGFILFRIFKRFRSRT
jgi:hypothetical protein